MKVSQELIVYNALSETQSLDDDLEKITVFKQASRQSKRLKMRQKEKLKALIVRSNSAEHLALVSNIMAISNTPKTIEEALASPEKKQWRVAIESEYQSLIKNLVLKIIFRYSNLRKFTRVFV